MHSGPTSTVLMFQVLTGLLALLRVQVFGFAALYLQVLNASVDMQLMKFNVSLLSVFHCQFVIS